VVGSGADAVPEIFENVDLDLAVARGAAYYSYVRSTRPAVCCARGLSATYYIGLGEVREGKFPAVCLVPRGAEEGAAIRSITTRCNWSRTGPCRFVLYSSLTAR